MIRCRILNFNNFDFISLVNKYSVCRFAPRPVRVLDKFPHDERFFSPYGKNLSPCGKFNDINAKHKQKTAILPVREPAKDKLFILYSEDLPHGERFLPYVEKNLSPCGNLSRTRTGARSEAANPILLNFNIKNENFKILNPSQDGQEVPR
jgi:hypothetical protein